MAMKRVIAVVAPSCPLDERAAAVASERANAFGVELRIHPQCFLEDGHFAGPDEARLAALREVMADDSVDAVWFARGGYGSNRIAEAAASDLPEAARGKTYLGYSDAGFLLAAFHKAGLEVAHGPMVRDAVRPGGEEAIDRALAWLTVGDLDALEPGLKPGQPVMAFNLTVLSNLLGTALEPDFAGVELLIEDVGEYAYAIDRTMFHVTSSPAIRSISRLRLGRMNDMLENDRPFGSDPDSIIADWCKRAGIPLGAPANIGHDVKNRVVPFIRCQN